MDKNFRVIERRNKNGKITVIEHIKTGYRSLVLSGKCVCSTKTALSKRIAGALRSVGRVFLHSFPSLLSQTDFIVTFDPNASRHNCETAKLEYQFQYVIADDISTEKALNISLGQLSSFNEMIEKKIKSIDEEYEYG